jgi:hypothetical protein
MKRIALVLLLIVLPTAAPAQEIIAPPGKTKPATVPFEILKTRHLAVMIKVNGKGPFRVIFDTGAPVTLINNRIAAEAEVISKEEAKKPAFFGMRGQGSMKVKTLEMGDLKAEDVPVIVMDHPALKAVSGVLGPLDGIVGFPFFARYRMTIDYQASRMTMEPTDYRPADLMNDMMMMLMAPQRKPVKKILAPAAVWGFEVDKEAGDEEAGVTVKRVLPAGPAAEAGLKAGDRLLVLDAHWTDSVVDCHRAAAGVPAGQTVKLKLQRGEKEIEMKITPRAGL